MAVSSDIELRDMGLKVREADDLQTGLPRQRIKLSLRNGTAGYLAIPLSRSIQTPGYNQS